jgi:hypothetical protein
MQHWRKMRSSGESIGFRFDDCEKSIHWLAEAHMAIALQPRFPIPDRSKQPVRAEKDEDGVVDIGWCDGVLSDGRPFRAEMWAQDQVSCLTIFFLRST